jgi:phosphoribosylanthranilate isomerase
MAAAAILRAGAGDRAAVGLGPGPHVKICGLSTGPTLDAAISAGATMVGFVFHPRSPRYVTPHDAAGLSARVAGRALRIALMVDPDDAAIEAIMATLAPDAIQLHGAEPPARVDEVRRASGRPVIKAVGIATREDLAALGAAASTADLLLLDAKPPKNAAYPGGHGRPFDWSILAAAPPRARFLLSGGLDAANVAEAVGLAGAGAAGFAGVDVSSGVEASPGLKDVAKITAFVVAARAALAGTPQDRAEEPR